MPLQATVLTNATVFPWREFEDDDRRRGKGGHGSAGVATSDGRWLPDSGFVRYGYPRVSPPDNLRQRIDKPALRREGPAIFGGYVFTHFGHFVCETPARLWLARDKPEVPVLWSRGGGLRKGWQNDLLAILGIRNPHEFPKRPVLVEGDLHFGPAGYVLGERFEPDYAAFLGVWPEGSGAAKVWLSRSQITKEGKRTVATEPEIEAQLAARGWTIYHPQHHPLREQLDLLANAREVAGFVGSAFHLLMFLRTVRARVTLFTGAGKRDTNYDVIAATKGFEQRFVVLDIRGDDVTGGADPVLAALA